MDVTNAGKRMLAYVKHQRVGRRILRHADGRRGGVEDRNVVDDVYHVDSEFVRDGGSSSRARRHRDDVARGSEVSGVRSKLHRAIYRRE